MLCKLCGNTAECEADNYLVTLIVVDRVAVCTGECIIAVLRRQFDLIVLRPRQDVYIFNVKGPQPVLLSFCVRCFSVVRETVSPSIFTVILLVVSTDILSDFLLLSGVVCAV